MSLLFEFFTRDEDVEQINDMLEVMGLPPVASLSNVSRQSDAGMAMRTYFKVIREAQGRGWWFNSQYRQEFAPDLNNNILVNKALHVRPSPPQPGELMQDPIYLVPNPDWLTSKVVNATTNSDEWTDPLCLDVVYLKNSLEIPEELREYALARASRKFAAKFGQAVDPTDEQQAWVALLRKDSELGQDPNLFLNPQIYTQVFR
jgi:hypothetical protein